MSLHCLTLRCLCGHLGVTVDSEKSPIFGLSNVQKEPIVGLSMQQAIHIITTTTKFTPVSVHTAAFLALTAVAAGSVDRSNLVKPELGRAKLAVLSREQNATAAGGPLESPHVLNLQELLFNTYLQVFVGGSDKDGGCGCGKTGTVTSTRAEYVCNQWCFVL